LQQFHPATNKSTKNGFEWHISSHPFDDIYVDAYRRGNRSHFNDQYDDNPEPVHIDSESMDQRKQDGNRENNKGKAAHKAAADQVDEDDDRDDSHRSMALGTGERAHLIDFLYQPCPAFPLLF
jgi:hypothetical protein